MSTVVVKEIEIVPGAGIGCVTTISRSPNKLDAFVIGLDGHVYTAAWELGDSTWRGWWLIDGIETAPCAMVTAISRSVDKLDIFVVGLDGYVHTAAWEPGDTFWRGWWQIGNLETTLHAPISAVSKSVDKLDIFATDVNGVIQTAAWEPVFTDGWHEWWELNGGRAAPGAPVTAVSRSADKLDIFVVGINGGVYTAAWEPGFTDWWHGWWQVPGLNTLQRTPIAAVSRSTNKLDIFVVGLDGNVYSAAWEPEFTDGWHGWGQIPGLNTLQRTPIAVVSRSVDELDIFAVGLDGNVYTAAWEPGDTSWRGWWQIIGGLSILPRTAISAVSKLVDTVDISVVNVNGNIYSAVWEQWNTSWRGWYLIAGIVTGMTDPMVSEWAKVGTAFQSENTNYSSEAQGMTTDGEAWYLCSNGSKTIRKYDNNANLLAEIKVPVDRHIGAPGCFKGWIYVPVQKLGVWKTDTNFSAQKFITENEGESRFPWCDVNPLNGRLYTVEDIYTKQNITLFAYDRETLERQPEDDIDLGLTPSDFYTTIFVDAPIPFPVPIPIPNTYRIQGGQGGVFTSGGRVIISRSDPNCILCFSSITGYYLGGCMLGDFGSTGSELEGVTVREWYFDVKPAHVHLLELDNDFLTKDDCYLQSYSVPEPNRL